MRVRTVFAILVAVTAAAFFAVNWSVFATPVKLSFVFGTVEIPIGLVMLALFAALLAVLWSFVGVWQSTLLLEFRRQGKELQAQRSLAESAEASRFTALGTLVREEIASSDQRLEAALEAMRKDLHETENSIAATLGEMDDRFQRATNRNLLS